MKTTQNNKAFTLIELLVVIAILAILSTVVFVALNPIQRFQDSRNARRFQDVNSILTSVHEYIVDNDADLPYGLTSGMGTTELGTCTAGNANCTTATDCVDLSTVLSSYLASVPIDPDSGEGSAATTGYTIAINSDNIVTVSACHAENGETVQVSR